MIKQKYLKPIIEDRELYTVALDLSKNSRKKLRLRFPVKIFVQDPLVAEKHKKRGILGIEEIDLDWEPGLMDGPTSARVAVVDYNAETRITAKPVKWDPIVKKFINADDPSKYQFHQVNAWAIVQNALTFFEDPHVMGRPIPWGFKGNRLIVVPHAGLMKNAFYDRQSKSLQFYYFNDNGKPVYTCLSHDIVAHETGHAILDGIRPFYYEISSPQTAAFHEFLADLTAILSAFRNNNVRQAIAKITNGNLREDRVIGDLAEEFAHDEVKNTYGEAQRYYLRTAHNNLTIDDIKDEWESHYCSQVLTGTMFEILTNITKLHKDKGRSPKEALWKATDHLNRLAFRALDYCPPVDIQFIDYAQALLRANELAYPKDILGYQDIIKGIFKKRGLTQLKPSIKPPRRGDLLSKWDINSIASSRTAAYHYLNDNRGKLSIPMHQDIKVVDLYYTDKIGADNEKLPREIILEYIWEEDVILKGERFSQFQGQTIPLLCGGTLVFDGRENILYWSKKDGTQKEENINEGKQRKKNLLDYIEKLIYNGMIGLVIGEISGDLDIYQPPIIARQRNGTLHLEMTANLLHTNNELGGLQ